jgi:hypothetical protein
MNPHARSPDERDDTPGASPARRDETGTAGKNDGYTKKTWDPFNNEKIYRVCRLTRPRIAARPSDLDPEEAREKTLLNVTLVSDGSERRVCVGWIAGVGAM